ncbi:MAG: hypothetical protein J6S85_23065 [Methanobrevibacter sp.]|nr:hypothetical protein [Methanobrevibacter sp.]
MAVKSSKKVIHISIDKEVLDSINLVIKTLRNRGIKITKSSMFTALFTNWIKETFEELEEIRKGEEKKNA